MILCSRYFFGWACIYVIVRATMISAVFILIVDVVLHGSAHMSPYLNPCRDRIYTAMISEFGQSRRLKRFGWGWRLSHSTFALTCSSHFGRAQRKPTNPRCLLAIHSPPNKTDNRLLVHYKLSASAGDIRRRRQQ